MIRRSSIWIFLLCILFNSSLLAQDDLLSLLDEEQEEVETIEKSLWKAQRLINGHTTKTRAAGELEFIIMHRFGQINTGIDDLFGLDFANIRFSFEYGISDRLTLGLGRSSFEKIYDGFAKYSILQQGDRSPVALSWFSSIAVRTADKPTFSEDKFVDRTAYTHQLLIARKLSDKASVLFVPSYVHRNRVEHDQENDYFALGIGGRYKLNPRVSLITEYYLGLTKEESDLYNNSFGIGVEIETGGHVFQLTFTNSRSMVEKGFITETTGAWQDGDIHFGFNLSRTF